MMGANKSVDFLISFAGGAADGIEVIVGQNEAAMLQQGVPQELINDYASALRIVYKDRINGKEIDDKSKYIEDLCNDKGFTLPNNFTSNLANKICGASVTFVPLSYKPKVVNSSIARSFVFNCTKIFFAVSGINGASKLVPIQILSIKL